MLNTAITEVATEGIVQNSDCKLLTKYGDNTIISKHWEKLLLAFMGFIKGRVTTKAKLFVDEFEKHKLPLLFDNKAIIEMEDISEGLIMYILGTHRHPLCSSW